MKKFLISVVALAAMALSANSTDNNVSPRFLQGIEAEVRPGFVLPTNDFFRGHNEEDRNINTSLSAHLRYSLHNLGLDMPSYQGVGVAVTDFRAPRLLGTPVSAYVFQGGQIISFSDRLSLNYEWNFGASFGWKKYSDIDIVSNGVIGSHVNAYINLGVTLSYMLSPEWTLIAGIDGSHYSNGNTNWPNRGMNTTGLRIGMAYVLGPTGRLKSSINNDVFERGFSYDVVLFGAVRKSGISNDDISQVLPGRFGVCGICIAPMYDMSRHFRFGVSADIRYDESSHLAEYWVPGTNHDDIRFYRPPFLKQVLGGLSVRAEWVMPIFSVNAGVGHNIFGPRDDRKLYQILALKTYLYKGFFLHTGYQLLDFRYSSHLMMGFGYRFH